MNFVRIFGRFAVTLAAVLIAVFVGRQIWISHVDDPWTRDGRVRADVVAVTPDVSGLIATVLIHDEQTVKKGDILFRIDSERFDIALQQADAVVAARKATLDQTMRDYNRYRQLNTLSTSEEKQEQTIENMQLATANYRLSLADRRLAALNLDRSVVKAPVNGTITNSDLRPGDYVSAGKGVFALVDSDTIRVDGYFEETKLARMSIGDRVSIRLMGAPTVLRGHIESIASAIADRERTPSQDLLANITPTFTWVRLAQRIPVRIALDDVPATINLVVGRSATVVVENGTMHTPFNIMQW